MSRRLKYLETQIDVFVKQYERTSRRNPIDPNDRPYSRTLEEVFKRMDAWEFNELLYGEGQNDDQIGESEP